VSRSERILVTGAAGFTGRHLCRLLMARGHRVFGLTERATDVLDDGVTALSADLLDAPALRAAIAAAAPGQVVHLAGIAFAGDGAAEPVYRVNLLGTLALLEALAANGHGARGVLLPSTGAVYAASTMPLTEDAPVAPGSHYAASKLAMETMARLFAARLPLIVARPFNYTGPGQREPFLVPKIVRHFAQRASVIELGNVDVARDFLDVYAVVDAYARLLDEPNAIGATFNLCSGHAVAVRDIVAQLEAIAAHRVTIRINPAFVRPDEPARIVGAADRLVRCIGPLRGKPFAETLAEMLNVARSEQSGSR
jgi:nucleoside-diphosphate-sugar epimerase